MMTNNPQVNTELIARRAYEIWQGEGQPAGKAIDHWRQAEREVLAAQLHAKESAANPAPPVATGAKPGPQTGTGKGASAGPAPSRQAAR